LARYPQVCDDTVVDLEVHDDLITAERIEPLDPVRGWDRQLATVPWRAVMIQDDLPVEVFEAGHGSLFRSLVSAEECFGGVECV
jgi:hypothetical protein